MLITFHMQMPGGHRQGLPSHQGLCAAAPAVPSLPLNGSPQGARSDHKWAPIKACWRDPGGLQMATPALKSYSSQWAPPSSLQD